MDTMNKSIIIIIVIITVAGAGFWFYNWQSQSQNQGQETEEKEQDEIKEEQIKIEILKPGTGKLADVGNTVVVHYTGTFEDGTKFDSSLDREQPFIFKLGEGQVIKGWEQGILGMKIGEKRKLTIGPDLAYGKMGIPGAIPPNAVLIFEVELLEIQ
ncbi:FKBP-type peptidyl-prolyl cis-trans isomerase [Candidatus Parcubacteria bacterium]|nr:FKBP-type peptidyl-prolyl cis-trans isomerase [Candidatus Parcubacteria bacterium]